MELNSVKKKLSKKSKQYLSTFSEYLDIPFYYFGSILRDDYVAGASDVDIDIFTDNEESTIAKILNYLNMPQCQVKKVIWILRDKTTTYGYKIQQTLDDLNIFEYSIYNKRFKDKILSEHRGKIILPVYISLCLKLLKTLYYTLHIISNKTYAETKRFMLSYGLGQSDEDKFLVF